MLNLMTLPNCPQFFPIVDENTCEIRLGSVKHTASKALIQEPFLFPNYILQTDIDGNLHAV